MVYIEEEFMGKPQALKWFRDTMDRYPAAQFGTKLSMRFNRYTQFWQVTGHRFSR